jgi:hypothetical protein
MAHADDKLAGTQLAPAAPKKPLSPAAERALAEAAARRAQQKPDQQPAERQGRGGLDPVRYGDWEVKGIASDF